MSSALATSSARQASSAQSEQQRLDFEMANPKHPDLVRGVFFANPAAPITIVEYTDFECSYCRQERAVIVERFKNHGDRMRLVVKSMPLPLKWGIGLVHPGQPVERRLHQRDGLRARRLHQRVT
jgi:hypothetical protein